MRGALRGRFALGWWGTQERRRFPTELAEDKARDIPGREVGGGEGPETAGLTPVLSLAALPLPCLPRAWSQSPW